MKRQQVKIYKGCPIFLWTRDNGQQFYGLLRTGLVLETMQDAIDVIDRAYPPAIG